MSAVSGSHLRQVGPCRTAARWSWLLAVLMLGAAAGGCVQRRLTIRSNPPGALVYIDNFEIGTTPVSTDYIYYGTREIRLVKDGFETLTLQQPIPPPWYQLFPIDFVSENLVPAQIRDERTLEYQLVPQRTVPTGQLLGRGEELRRATQSSAVPLPLGVAPGAGSLPPFAAPPAAVGGRLPPPPGR